MDDVELLEAGVDGAVCEPAEDGAVAGECEADPVPVPDSAVLADPASDRPDPEVDEPLRDPAESVR